MAVLEIDLWIYMKTKCPQCNYVFELPAAYENKKIKCTRCKESFVSEKFVKDPVVVPILRYSSRNFITKAWAGIPKPFKMGFFATLGITSALLLSLYVFVCIFVYPSHLPIEQSTEAFSFSPDAAVTLIDYKFEVHEKKPDQWAFIWHAWVLNGYPTWVKGQYYLEFRNMNGSLLELIGPLETTFPNTEEPREAADICWLPAYKAKQVDFSKSKIFIKILN